MGTSYRVQILEETGSRVSTPAGTFRGNDIIDLSEDAFKRLNDDIHYRVLEVVEINEMGERDRQEDIDTDEISNLPERDQEDKKQSEDGREESEEDEERSLDDLNATNAAIELLKLHDINPRYITGTGEDDRILKSDVQHYVDNLVDTEDENT